MRFVKSASSWMVFDSRFCPRKFSVKRGCSVSGRTGGSTDVTGRTVALVLRAGRRGVAWAGQILANVGVLGPAGTPGAQTVLLAAVCLSWPGDRACWRIESWSSGHCIQDFAIGHNERNRGAEVFGSTNKCQTNSRAQRFPWRLPDLKRWSREPDLSWRPSIRLWNRRGSRLLWLLL